ncbi:MAG: hypothetical protein ACLFPQ_03995 [Candidatus Woesearchaeota archaeon]
MNLCYRCKGRGFCGHKCTIFEKLKVQKKVNLNFKQDFYGKTPNVFVGKFGYPNVNVGLLSTEQEAYKENDNPLLWSKNNYSVGKVVDLRSELVNSSFSSNINIPRQITRNRFEELSKELSLSKKPVDTELHLKQKPQFRLSFNQEAAPHGPNSKLEKAEATENIRIPTKIDKAVSDYDYKAGSALSTLYKRFDEHYLTKILSVGNLGIKTQRKLVPTRWAITAVDDTLGKDGIKEIRDFSNNMDYTAYFGGHMGNYYIAMFFPDCWSYELFESYLPKSVYNQGNETPYSTDYESFSGRKEYAYETAGGYYAARLPVIDFLKEKKRQSSVILLRFITSEYWAPLGVWVVRESVKKTLKTKGITFSSKELMIEYAKKLVKKKFDVDIKRILEKSKLLNNMKNQSKLNRFF